jgi:hypothetical protein
MAKRKKTTRARRRKSAPMMSAPRRARRRRSRAALSELFNPTTAAAAGRAVGAGAIGGMIAGGVSRLLTNRPAYERILAVGAASFVTYAVLGYPHMASGMAGALAATESAPIYNKFMSEGSLVDYADVDALNTMPTEVMSENGETLTLAEVDGEMVYLNEDNQISLAETAYLQQGIYPDYSVQY